MTDWKDGDEAITSGSGERVTLLRLQGHDIYSGPASDGRLWICRLSVATKPSDAVEFGVRECNMRPVSPLLEFLGPKLPCGRFAVFTTYRPAYQDEPAVLSCPCGNYCHNVPPGYDAWMATWKGGAK